MIYNIPINQLPYYNDKTVIIRCQATQDLEKLLQYLGNLPLSTDQSSFEIIHIEWDLVALDDMLYSLFEHPLLRDCPIDVQMRYPHTTFAYLYHYAKLLESHPIRISIAVESSTLSNFATEFYRAVKIASALQFAIRLDINQPNPEYLEQLSKILDFYLHQATVSQPIEYFHTLLVAYYHQRIVSLWDIQEQHPGQWCYVTEQGQECFGRRSLNDDDCNVVPSNHASYPPTWLSTDAPVHNECQQCEFWNSCRGFHKWPDSDWSCIGIKKLFSTLQTAATQIKENMQFYDGLPK